MRSSAQDKLLSILLKALKPLVHMLLEAGIGHREFSEIAKKAYVDVATKNYGIRGRATNISRVAVMTGLTRKEVKKIRDMDGKGSDPDPRLKPIPASVVLSAWYNNDRFKDADGNPAILEFDADGDSFRQLVKEYAGDIPPGAIRTELKRTGAIEVLSGGRVKALRREFVEPEGFDRMARAIARPLSAMLLNIRQNNLFIQHEAGKLPGWPERIVSVDAVPEHRLEDLKLLLDKRVRDFSEQIDLEIQRFDGSDDSGESVKYSVGLGLYYFNAQA